MPAQIPTNPESSTTMTIQYTARQLDALNERALYGVACEQMNEARLDNSRWQMAEWHPDGAHLWNGTGLHIVATSFTTDHRADVGVYTERAMEEMNDTVTYMSCPLGMVGSTVHALMDVYGNQTDLMHPLEDAATDPRAMIRPTVDPLPAPWPSAVELAALYIAEVRSNGPTFMSAVAEGFSDELASYEVMTEIAEMWARHGFAKVDWYCNDETTDRANDACIDAADLAIKTFAADMAVS